MFRDNADGQFDSIYGQIVNKNLNIWNAELKMIHTVSIKCLSTSVPLEHQKYPNPTFFHPKSVYVQLKYQAQIENSCE